MAVIVVVMVSLLLTTYVAMTISERKRIEHEAAGASAEYIAKAGLERVFFDLASEYEKDKSWINGNTINGVIINGTSNDTLDTTLDLGEGMPTFNLTAQTEAPNERSNYQKFYTGVNFPNATASVGNYTVNISFLNNANDTAFMPNKLWVCSTGTVNATNDSITLTQLARNMPVARGNITGAPTPEFAINKTYDYLDQAGNSAVLEWVAPDEIRIAPAIINGTVNITGGSGLIIKGGYDFDFTNASRNTDEHQSILTSATEPVVNITGGTVVMGGVRIE